MKLLRPLRDESGIAVPIALAVLLVAVLLAGVATTLAIQANATSVRDTNSKAAIEAADAGLRTALYRLNTYQPDGTHCPTQPMEAQVGSSGAPTATLCPPDGPDVPQGLGNGATFNYWISRAMQPGDTCTGPSLSSTVNTVAQRCVTAVGTANGVSARVQQRVAAYTSAPAFPAAIFGTNGVTISNNVTIASGTPGSPALLGTNGTLQVNNNATIDGYQLPPGATYVQGKNVANLGPTAGISAPYPTPTPIYPFSTSQNTATPYDTATTNQAGTCYQSEAQSLGWTVSTWTQTNCDYEISQGIEYPSCLNRGLPVRDCDSSSGLASPDFDPVNRTLYVPNNASLVLQGGYYNFCSFYLSNNSSVSVASGQATIFIDSPDDSTSGCPTQNSNQGVPPGSFTTNQNTTLNAGGTALNLQILVYGDQKDTPPTRGAVNLQNNGASAFALLAPFSNVNLNNNTKFQGAIAGYSVTIANNTQFTYEADTSTFQAKAVPVYYPSSWEQCPAQYSADPTSGC